MVRRRDDQVRLRRRIQKHALAEVPVSQRETGLRREGLRGRRRGQRRGRLDPTCRQKVGQRMSRKQDIEIVINAKGEVTFQIKGVKGGSCLDETKFLEQALGGEVL